MYICSDSLYDKLSDKFFVIIINIKSMNELFFTLGSSEIFTGTSTVYMHINVVRMLYRYRSIDSATTIVVDAAFAAAISARATCFVRPWWIDLIIILNHFA